MPRYESKVKLPPFDDLFSTEAERQDAMLEKVQILPIGELHPFKNHPYQVRDDGSMDDLVQSIRAQGVVNPLLVRPIPDNGGYEIIAGHRRQHGAMKAGVADMPCIVREMSDDDAILCMVDSNCQREDVLPSEKAKAYQMKLEAIKRKAGRPTKENSAQLEQNYYDRYSVEKVAEDAGASRAQVQRYIRLNELIPELQEKVDDKKLAFNPAVALSYLSKDQQKAFQEYIEDEQVTPSLSQAQQLKTASQDGKLDTEKLKEIMTAKTSSVKAREMQVILPMKSISKYFPAAKSPEDAQQMLMKLLEEYYRRQHRSFDR